MTTIAISEPSIFISHVFPNKAEMVYETFAELFGADYIDDVDVVTHDLNGQEICRAYVHFKSWPTDHKFQRLRSRLMAGETVKVIYEEPWYWKCVASKLPRITSKGSMTSPPKKRIVLDEPFETVYSVKSSSQMTDKSAKPAQANAESSIRASWAEKVKKPEDITVEPVLQEKIEEVKPKTQESEPVVEQKTQIETETQTQTPAQSPDMTSTTAVVNPAVMSALQYEYCCYTRGLTLKSKESFVNYLGTIIYPIVEKMSPVFCSKITGMLLEIDIDALVKSLEDKSMFNTLVVRCYVTLQETLVSEMSAIMDQ
jgi:hypothetical protein